MSNSDSDSGSMRKVPLGRLATGLERQGAVTRQGSTPLPSFRYKQHVSKQAVRLGA